MHSSSLVKPKSINIFFSYASQVLEDKQLQQELEKQLSVLKRHGLIINWHWGDIQAGQEWEHEIAAHINSADIILLLVSPDFIASDHCYGIEMKRAMQRHERGEARVVPILLRPTLWKDAPFGKLQPLPKNGKSVTSWADRDEAFLDVAVGIRDIVDALSQRASLLVSESDVPEKNIENFSEVLERFRNERQISKKDLAIRAHLTPGYISLLTSGERRQPSRETIDALADALQLDSKSRQNLFEAATLPPPSPTKQGKTRRAREDWGEAPSVQRFYGRQEELTELERWLIDDHCQVIAVLGIGGVGKTSLSAKLAHQLSDSFDIIFWRSMQDALPVEIMLRECIQFLSDQKPIYPLEEEENPLQELLLKSLRDQRCLIVLDNFESILQSGALVGEYQEGYKGYGKLIQRMGEVDHQSCLLLTSREKPKEIARLEGTSSQVRSKHLHGMKPSEIKEILKDKDLFASDKTLDDLTHLYRGNPLALKLIAETIREVFGGNVAAFLNRGETVFGDFHAFLNQQFHRLSEQEKGIMYWLAIGREAVSLEELEADLIPKGSGEDLLAIINSLRRRSMIENSSSVNFALQPVIMEYVTGEFIKHIYSEVEIGRIKLLASHALVKSETKSLVKDNQVRLILTPILERLLKAFGREGTEKKLKEMLSIFHQGSAQIAGYAAINIDHLLTKLYKDSTYDFSSDSGAVLPARSMPP